MNRLLAIGFFALLAISAAVIVATSADLPVRVASHFAADGSANGWQSRETYVAWMLAFGIALPCVVAVAVGWLPRRFPRLTNLPHKDYWLAPARRDTTLAALGALGFAIGSLAALFALAVHVTVVAANAAVPPKLANALFVLPLAFFIAGLIVLVGVFHYRFRVRR